MRNQTRRFAWRVALLCVLGSMAALARQADPPRVSPDRYLADVRYLASPGMQGRGNGTAELDRAAEYLAARFEAAGLRPAGEDGSWYQVFQVTTGTEIGGGSVLALPRGPVAADRFSPLRFSSRARVTAPVVFVGYGITAPEMHWDDYAGIDAEGKIVVALRHEPQENDPESPFAGTEFTSHASLRNKAVNAKQHGALGIVFLLDPNNHGPEDEQIPSLVGESDPGDAGIAVAYASMAPIVEAFGEAGIDLGRLQSEIDTQMVSRSLELTGPDWTLGTDVVRVQSQVRNVLAALPGSDPVLADEWIVVGAHYDHLGLDGEFSLDPEGEGRIHHGADDNASGTAGVLELARLAAANRDRLPRSLLFMGFAAEEIGLLGSSHFVNNPTLDLGDVVAMLNLDMIGRIENDRVFVSGVGTSPGFREMVGELAAAGPLSVDFSESGMGASDHMSFNLARVPVLFFFSGLHSDYHRPTDTAEKINAGGAAEVLGLAWAAIDRLARLPERPEYIQVEEPRPISGSGGGYGPYFGSVPDFRDDLGGVLFADVTPGSPADTAGLRSADLLVEFAGKPVGNLYDFTYALQAQVPGDVVTVTVVRDGERVSVEVTLGSR